MADRRKNRTTLPCRNTHCECHGKAVCRTSELKKIDGVDARVRDRYCNVCGRHTQTHEVEVRVLFSGRKPEAKKSDDSHCRKLF